jgi:hypothetical protein
MNSFSPAVGRRAQMLVPALARPGAVAAVNPATSADDMKMFWTTLFGGLVVFGTFLA